MEHEDGPTGFCEQLCRCGLLVHAALTAESSTEADQRYSVRRCTGQWELRLVPAEAEAAARLSSNTSASQPPPDTPGPAPLGQDGDHQHVVGTLDDDLAHLMHTPDRAEFLRHASADGNEV